MGEAIATKVSNGTMPPWHADPATGEFVNERRLARCQKETIPRWVEAGAPEGNLAELLPAPSYSAGWDIGQPDAILECRRIIRFPPAGTIA